MSPHAEHADAFRRPLPAMTRPRCGQTPPGMLSAEPLHRLVCVLAPGHEVQHINARGDKWGPRLRAIDRVPERATRFW